MATWIAHLRIAENLLQTIPRLDAGAFAVGNIAPDSGVPDEKWEKYTPPPEVSHFATRPFRLVEEFNRSPEGALTPTDRFWRMADLTFYRQYLAVPVEGKRFSFLLGYFCHLVTDNLWEAEIGRPTVRRFAAEFAADRGFIHTVKGDWYGLDFIYLRDHPDALFWRTFLQCAYDEAYAPDFMPAEAVRQRIAYIQTWYQEQNDQVRALYGRPYVYGKKPESPAACGGGERLGRRNSRSRVRRTGFFLGISPANHCRALPAARGWVSRSPTACGGEIHLAPAEMDRFVADMTEKLLRLHGRLFGVQTDLAGLVSALELLGGDG